MKPIKHLKLKLALTAVYGLLVLLLQQVGIYCLFRLLFGFPCPGCGMTRAWLRVLRGDLAGAFALHGMFWSVPLLYLYILYDGKLFCRPGVNRGILLLLGIGFGLHWLIQLA